MFEGFKAVMFTLFILPGGDFEERPTHPRIRFNSYEECEYLKRQREYTLSPPNDTIGVVMLCQLD